MRNEGEVIGKNGVARIMNELGIEGVSKKKFKPQTTTSNHELPVAERSFKTEVAEEQVTKSNQYWDSEITYVATEEGWLYLAVVIDLFTRKVVGHSMNESMPCALVINALDMGLKRQGLATAEDLVTHTDQGSQYAAQDYIDKLAAHKIVSTKSGPDHSSARCRASISKRFPLWLLLSSIKSISQRSAKTSKTRIAVAFRIIS